MPHLEVSSVQLVGPDLKKNEANELPATTVICQLPLFVF